MPQHLVAYETSASEAALTALTPVPDGVVAIQGNDIFVPVKMGNVAWAAAMINSAIATLRAQLISPSLRAVVPVDISPIVNGLVFGSVPPFSDYRMAPLPLVEQEPLDFTVQNGAAVMNRGLVSFTDGPIKPVPGKVYTVRFTTSITMVTATWVNGAITFGTTLPAGNYQVVGLRMWSANGVAARLFFKGSIWRPGVPMLNAEANNDLGRFRFGNNGIFDVFNNVTPPSVDALGVTDTAQVGFLDLVKTS